MAEINLLPRKEFEIMLADKSVIKGQFGTWALKRMCQKLGCKLYELTARFAPKDENDQDLPAEIEIYTEFLLCAVEQSARQKNESFSYTDVHAGAWIDELGGRDSVNMSSLFKHSADEVKLPEKKTEEKAA